MHLIPDTKPHIKDDLRRTPCFSPDDRSRPIEPIRDFPCGRFRQADVRSGNNSHFGRDPFPTAWESKPFLPAAQAHFFPKFPEFPRIAGKARRSPAANENRTATTLSILESGNSGNLGNREGS